MSKTYRRRHSAMINRQGRKADSLKTHKQRRANKRVKIRKELSQ